jgi:type IV pilus assembly protein PilB
MVQISRLGRKKIGEVLVEEGVLKEDQLREAQLRVRSGGEHLVETLHSLGFATETEVARVIAKKYGLPFIDASRYRIPRDAAEAVPVAFLRLNQMLVLDKIGRTLLVAVGGGLNLEALEKVERMTGCQVFVYVSVLSKITSALDKIGGPAAPAAAAKK